MALTWRYGRGHHFLVLVGLGLLGLAMTVAGLMWVRPALAAERAYWQASICQSNETSHCLWQTDAQVIAVDLTASTGPNSIESCEVTLRLPGGTQQTAITEGRQTRLCQVVEPGQIVRVKSWQRQVVEVETSGQTFGYYLIGYIWGPSMLLLPGSVLAAWSVTGLLLMARSKVDRALDLKSLGVGMLLPGAVILYIFINGIFIHGPIYNWYWYAVGGGLVITVGRQMYRHWRERT